MLALSKILANLDWYYFIVLVVVIQVAIGLIITRTKFRPYAGQIIVATTILTISLLFLLMTFAYPSRGAAMERGSTAVTVPRLWISALIVVSAGFFYSVFRGKEKLDEPLGRLDVVAKIVLLLSLTIFSFEYIGYYIGAAIFLPVCMYILTYRNYKTMAIIPIVWVAFSYFVFANLLYVPLPLGSIIERFL